MVKIQDVPIEEIEYIEVRIRLRDKSIHQLRYWEAKKVLAAYQKYLDERPGLNI